MLAIAAELRVDRATLFRWIVNREALLGPVLSSVGAPTWGTRSRAEGPRAAGKWPRPAVPFGA